MGQALAEQHFNLYEDVKKRAVLVQNYPTKAITFNYIIFTFLH